MHTNESPRWHACFHFCLLGFVELRQENWRTLLDRLLSFFFTIEGMGNKFYKYQKHMFLSANTCGWLECLNFPGLFTSQALVQISKNYGFFLICIRFGNVKFDVWNGSKGQEKKDNTHRYGMFPVIALWVVLFIYMASIAERASRVNYALLWLVFRENKLRIWIPSASILPFETAKALALHELWIKVSPQFCSIVEPGGLCKQ